MPSRTSNAALAFAVLAGCGAQSPDPGGVTMDCATGGAADLAPVCSVHEQKAADEVAYLVIWHPDGGFRRVRYLAAETQVEVLDGAEQASGVTREPDGSLAFAIAGDRYRLPADFMSRRADTQPTQQ
ncbi:MAG: hypothetical protein ACKO1O_03480 [Erythrobacter sp.]